MTDTQVMPVGTKPDLDAIVVGTGFAGIYMLHKLRDEQGLRVRAFDKAGGIGGTWYWNRYPGALSDSESFLYRYSFDTELLQEWTWKKRYLTQPEILSYLEHVVDRYSLRDDIQLNTGVTAMQFDEASNLWTVQTDTGETLTAKYVVTAVGVLSAANIPNIPGRETFAGEQYHTAAWPENIDLAGKRVGVIGTGSTGQQLITAIAPVVEHLTVFQRSPQYTVPVGNDVCTPEMVETVKRSYDHIWDSARKSALAFGFAESTLPAMSVSEEQRRAIFQDAWDCGGGFRFMFGTFGDIATDLESNEAAAAFIRSKIAEIVTDQEMARKLTPTDLYARRPLCGTDYYATYNRDNVSLVSVKETPITEITPTGVTTADGTKHELDVLIFATGFDAVDGNFKKLDVRGRGGVTLKEHWKDAPTSYLGMTTAGFPNLFMALGPNGPFTNIPPTIEAEVEWISDLIAVAEKSGAATVEATQAAEDGWTELSNQIAEMTLFPQADTWIFGANIPGKKKTVLFFLGGLGMFRQQLADVAKNDYKGLAITAPSLVTA